MFKITFFAFLIAVTFCTREPKNIISLKAGLKISNFTEKLTKDINYQTDLRTIANSTYMAVNNEQVIENKHRTLVNLPRIVGSSNDVLDYEIDYVKRDGSELQLFTDYAYNITYSDNLVTSRPKPIVNYPDDRSQLSFEFNILQPTIIPEIHNSPPLRLDNIVSVNYVFFGIGENKNLKMFNFFDNFNELNINDYMKEAYLSWNLDSKNLTNLVIDSNINDNGLKYILLTDIKNDSYIVEVSATYTEQLNIIIKPVIWYSDPRLNIYKVTDFIKKDDYFFIGLKGQGILCVSSKKSYYIEEYQNIQNGGKKVPLKVLDLQEVGNSLYVLIEDFGLKILNTIDPKDSKFTTFEFYHPYIKSMEIHRNPNYKSPFLGLVISDRSFTQGNEFFIELSLEEEFNPKLHKIYLNDKYMDIKYILNDPDYTYLLEYTSNSFYVLPRTITTNDYNSVFTVHVAELRNKETKGKPIIFTDFYDINDYLGFLTEDGITYVKTLNLNNAQMDLYFTQEGSYRIGLHTYTDNCDLPMDKVKMCKVNIDYTLHVAGLPANTEKIKHMLYYYLIGGYACFTIFLFVIYWKFYKEGITEKNLSESKVEAPEKRWNHSNIPTDRYERAVTNEANLDSVRMAKADIELSTLPS
jgi:hypothetical protein